MWPSDESPSIGRRTFRGLVKWQQDKKRCRAYRLWLTSGWSPTKILPLDFTIAGRTRSKPFWRGTQTLKRKRVDVANTSSTERVTALAPPGITSPRFLRLDDGAACTTSPLWSFPDFLHSQAASTPRRFLPFPTHTQHMRALRYPLRACRRPLRHLRLTWLRLAGDPLLIPRPP